MSPIQRRARVLLRLPRGLRVWIQLGQYPDLEDDEAPAKRESLRRLAEYVDQQLVAGRKLELFACWAGSEPSAATHHRRLHSKDFTAERFFLLAGELSIVERTA